MGQPDEKKDWAPWARRTAPIIWFVLAISAARLVYLMWLSPYTLAEDEAHYWEWSRHLSWSYYSKGPGVAWVIAAATGLFGNIEWAVKLPAILSAGVGSLASAVTARTVFEDKRTGFIAAVLYQCVPPFSVLGILMTIDGPFLASWAVACMAAVRTWKTQNPRWLILTGLALAAGFLFKYTIVLLIPGLVVTAVFGRRAVRMPAWAWLAAVGAFLLGLVPVAIWNAGHDWVTVRHLLGHLGLAGGDLPATQGTDGWHYSPMWTLTYLSMLLLGGPVSVMGLCSAAKSYRVNAGARILVAASVPVLLFYLAVTLFTEAEGNWALGGFVALVPLAAGVVPSAVERGRCLFRMMWRLSIVAGTLSLLAFPALPVLATSRYFGHLIPVHRLSGMRELATAAQARLDQLRDEHGIEPILMADHYGRASQLAFYMDGHPVVYSTASLSPWGRKSQYDLWQETDLRDETTLDQLAGRPGLLFGGNHDWWIAMFDGVEQIDSLPGEPKKRYQTFLGTGFYAPTIEQPKSP